MPKPVLSDSLFNADDVATAVLAEANLQIANSALGVVDCTSNISFDSAYTVNKKHMYSFNGFMFVSFAVYKASGTPGSQEVIATIDSGFRPDDDHYMPGIGFQGDVLEATLFKANGDVLAYFPTNLGGTAFNICSNGWYRIA